MLMAAATTSAQHDGTRERSVEQAQDQKQAVDQYEGFAALKAKALS